MLLSVGGEVVDQNDVWARFAVIKFDASRQQFVYSARHSNSTATSFICQAQQRGQWVRPTQSRSNEVRNIFYLLWTTVLLLIAKSSFQPTVLTKLSKTKTVCVHFFRLRKTLYLDSVLLVNETPIFVED